MGRRRLAAARAMARCLPSTPMARVLRTCIVSRAPLLILDLTLTATELIRVPAWLYPATPCMGRPGLAALRARGGCSPSAPMAWVLRRCIALPPAPGVLGAP